MLSVSIGAQLHWFFAGSFSEFCWFNHSLMMADLQIRTNDLARKMQKPFFGFGSFGRAAFVFVDLLDHHYSE